ncbi:MAG: universal stress protein [Gammaproteobacteria bacterium]|nr:universal stress protein [Gammaproteobacteria bacterium]MCW9056419.1 universal stress protein [Gammaproteobacteria bacterium]
MSDYQNILVAVDFSDAANTVISKALDMATGEPAKLTLIHVVEYLPPIDIAYEPVLTSSWTIDENELIDQAKNSLKKFSVKHKLENTEQIVVIGTPKHEITQYIKDHQCDLVILGSHGRHGLGLLLGSTANGVLHDMPCDVLAIKIKA